jgi:DNA-binding transcriptional regulator YiaG
MKEPGAARAIDRVTMRQFDQRPLAPTAPLRPTQIKRIGETLRVS